jgi:hypothetical protein
VLIKAKAKATLMGRVTTSKVRKLEALNMVDHYLIGTANNQ